HSLIFALRRRHGTRILRKGSPVFPPRGVRQTSPGLPANRHRTGADPFPPRDLCPPVTREYRRPPTGNTLCRLRVIGDIRQSRTKVGCLQRRFLPGPTKGLPQRPGRAARPAMQEEALWAGFLSSGQYLTSVSLALPLLAHAGRATPPGSGPLPTGHTEYPF